jgi:hypothetical protein
MRLIVAHQILIGSGIVLATLFAVRSAFMFGRGGETSELVLALASVLVAVGLGFYLRMVRAKWARERKRK